MPGERLTLWTSASAAAATVVAIAATALVFWNVTAKERAHFATELAALNAKVEKANETVAEIKKITALQSTSEELGLLNSELKKTNDKLAQLQKASSLDGIKSTLEQLDAKIEKTSKTVAEIKKITALENTAKDLDLLNSELKKTNDKLVELQKASSLDGIKSALAQLDAKVEKTGAALAELKKPAPADGMGAEFDGIKAALASFATDIEAKIEASNKTLADLKVASLHANDMQSASNAARDKAIAKLETAISDLKTGIADNASLQNKSLDAIAKSIDSLKTLVMAQKAGKEPGGLHVPEPPATETTSSIPAIQPLTIRFDKIGRANLDAQTNAIIGKLKMIMKDRRDCSLSVAGHTDTLGSDDVNLDVSKERADMVGARLKTAFAGQKIQIDSVGWGERRLKVLTPDGRRENANRRVEVSVDCKN